MAVSDSGSWKLFIYPVVFIVIFGLIYSLVINPFVSGGVIQERNNNIFVDGLVNTAIYGVPINYTILGVNVGILNVAWDIMPTSIKSYLANTAVSLYYVPEIIAIPITVIVYAALIYALIVLIMMVIP